MTVPDGLKGLRFACECVSAREGGYSDPWASVAREKLLPDGTKEQILNIVAQEPRTISQIAEALGLSAPSIHAHIGDLTKSELLRESEEWEKRHPTERYYEPNFPVVLAEEHAEFRKLCDEMAGQVADLFTKRRRQLERAYAQTELGGRGWEFEDVAQYLYACVQREARRVLEGRGELPARREHRNGAAWVFWAEESAADADKS